MKPKRGIVMAELLVVVVIGTLIAGIGMAAFAGTFSRETLESRVMDYAVAGLLGTAVVFCVGSWGIGEWKKWRSTR